MAHLISSHPRFLSSILPEPPETHEGRGADGTSPCSLLFFFFCSWTIRRSLTPDLLRREEAEPQAEDHHVQREASFLFVVVVSVLLPCFQVVNTLSGPSGPVLLDQDKVQVRLKNELCVCSLRLSIKSRQLPHVHAATLLMEFCLTGGPRP